MQFTQRRFSCQVTNGHRRHEPIALAQARPQWTGDMFGDADRTDAEWWLGRFDQNLVKPQGVLGP